MKLASFLFWTFVLIVLNISKLYAGRCPLPYKCQRWCPKVENQIVYFDCCDCVSKLGKCPSSEVPTYDHHFDLRQLQCTGDWDCPDGFKCCLEANYGPYDLCKQVIFNQIEEVDGIADENSSDMPVEKSGSGSGSIGLDYGSDDEDLADHESDEKNDAGFVNENSISKENTFDQEIINKEIHLMNETITNNDKEHFDVHKFEQEIINSTNTTQKDKEAENNFDYQINTTLTTEIPDMEAFSGSGSSASDHQDEYEDNENMKKENSADDHTNVNRTNENDKNNANVNDDDFTFDSYDQKLHSLLNDKERAVNMPKKLSHNDTDYQLEDDSKREGL